MTAKEMRNYTKENIAKNKEREEEYFQSLYNCYIGEVKRAARNGKYKVDITDSFKDNKKSQEARNKIISKFKEDGYKISEHTKTLIFDNGKVERKQEVRYFTIKW